MDPQAGHYVPPQSPSQLPASHVKYHHPYFSPTEVEYLSEKQRGKLSVPQERLRQQACAFIEAVGLKIGFPRKTIATAQTLYHRFHLFFPWKDFNYYDVTMACLYVSTKMHDTLKKPRDILIVSYTVRFPELAARSKAIGGEVEIDPATVEQDRQHLLGIERLILETVCFNFTVRMSFPYVIKIGRALRASKTLTRFAWRLAVDSNRTLAPLQYPPHVVALACIYLAALLSTFEQPQSQPQSQLTPQSQTQPQNGNENENENDTAMQVDDPSASTSTSTSTSEARSAPELVALLGKHGEWEKTYKACVEDLEEICHHLLDLLIHGAQNPSATTSPSTPSSPSPHTPRTPHPHHPHPSHPHPHTHAQHQHTQQGQGMQAPLPALYKQDYLLRLKIRLRETEHPPRPREVITSTSRSMGGPSGGGGAALAADTEGLGRNEGTVRFMFRPERFVAGE